MPEKTKLMKKHRFIILLFLAISIRLINISQPIMEGAFVRQSLNATIARNFYQDRSHILYPYISDAGGEKIYQLVEFPLLPYLASLIYFLLGGVYESVLRLISVVFFGLACIYLYRLMLLLFDEEIAFCASAVFSFSPLSIYLGRAFQYEMAMIFFILASIFYFYRWIDSQKLLPILISAASYTFALLLKIPNFYMLPVLFFIGFSKYKYKLFRMKNTYIFLGLILFIIILWYKHASSVMINRPNAYSIYYTDTISYTVNNIKLYLLKKDFYKVHFDNLITYTLTPIGFSLGIIGLLLLNFKNNISRLLLIWLSCILTFFALIPAQSMQGYYQVHLLPVFSALVAISLVSLRSLFTKEGCLNNKITLMVAAIVLFTILRYTYAYYQVPQNIHYAMDAAKAISRLTEKEATIIAAGDSSAGLIYYANRSGSAFTINLEEKKRQDIASGEDVTGRIYDPIVYLELLRSKGAKYFVSVPAQEFFGHEKFSRYMFENYRVIEQAPHYIIFDLKKG